MEENKSKLERERGGKTCRLCVALSLFVSIAGVELSSVLGHKHYDEISLPSHIPHESRIGFDMARPLMVSSVSDSTTSVKTFNDFI